MKKYDKVFIGNGKAPKNNPDPKFGIVSVTISMEKAEQFIYEKDGKKYLSFEIAPRENQDNFGRTHSAYLSVKKVEEVNHIDETPEETPMEKPKNTRRKKGA